MLSKLLTLTLITSLLAAPSPAKDTSSADIDGFDVGLDGLFGLADLGGIAGGGDTEITHEKREEEEIGFKLEQLIEELEETGDNEEDDLLGERVVELEEVEEVVEVEEDDSQTSTKSDTGDNEETETITDEGDKKEDEDDGKYKGKGHNYRHKKKED